MKLNNKRNKGAAHNERFGVMAAVARRKCTANLQLPAPQELLCNHRLREAATTLAVMRGRQCG